MLDYIVFCSAVYCSISYQNTIPSQAQHKITASPILHHWPSLLSWLQYVNICPGNDQGPDTGANCQLLNMDEWKWSTASCMFFTVCFAPLALFSTCLSQLSMLNRLQTPFQESVPGLVAEQTKYVPENWKGGEQSMQMPLSGGLTCCSFAGYIWILRVNSESCKNCNRCFGKTIHPKLQ